jgi:hypothetical protein
MMCGQSPSVGEKLSRFPQPGSPSLNTKQLQYILGYYKRSVADPDPGSVAFLAPESGMGKKSRSGIRIRDEYLGSYFPELRTNFLGYKYLNSLMRIRNLFDLVTGMEKFGSGILDKIRTEQIIRQQNKASVPEQNYLQLQIIKKLSTFFKAEVSRRKGDKWHLPIFWPRYEF